MKSVFKLLARVNRHFVPVPIRKQGKKEIPIAPEGATAYYVRFTKDGKRTTNALGKNLAHAFGTLKNYELGQAFEKAGMEIPPEITTEKSMTILEARDKYFADRKGLDVKTVHSYNRAIKLFISSCKKTYLKDIDRQDMLNFVNWLRQQPVRKRKHANPSRTWANRVGDVVIFLKAFGKHNLIGGSDFPKFHEKKIVAHTDEELGLLYSFANPEEQFLLDFFLGTMARRAESVNCKYADLTGTTVTFYGKQHKTRNVEISPRLASAIRARRETSHSEYIFGGGSGFYLYSVLQKLALRAGAKFHIEPHKLRKTGASRRLRSGVPLFALMGQLGHKNLNVTQKYLEDVAPEETKKAIAASDFVLSPQIVRTGTDGD